MKYVLLFLAATEPLCAQMTEQLVGHWRFDETSGTTAVNSFGASAAGTLTNFTGTPWISGRIGGALRLDGANDWVRVANYVKPTTRMTLSLWVFAESRPTWATFAKNWGSSVGSQFQFGLNAADGDMSAYITGSVSGFGPARESRAFPVNSWQHVAMTCDGGTVRIYRNGVRVGTTFSYSGSLVSNVGPFAFGAKTDDSGASPDTSAPGFWHGRIDDAGLWTRALSANEIYGIYSAGLVARDLEQAVPATPPMESVSINEFMAANSGGLQDEDGSSSDWIEIYNGLDTPLNLAGWRLTDDQSMLAKWTFPTTTIPAKSYFVVFASGNNRAIAGQQLHTNFQLGNNGEYLALVDPSGQVVSAYSPVPQATNVSFGVSRPVTNQEPPGSDGFNALLRYFPQPTPNAANTGGIEALGPRITDLDHTPLQPEDSDPLIIRARVVPASASVSSVTLKYKVMYGAEQTVDMFDDGAHGDGPAGDSVFGSMIPENVSTPGQMVRYYVIATDTAGKTSRWPLFADPTLSPQYQGTVVTNGAITTALPVLHWFLEDPAAAATDIGTSCSVFFLGEFYDNLDVRIRGASARLWPKKSYKLKFNDGYHFRFRAGVGRVDEININTTYTDKSYNRSVLAYEAMRDAGLPAPETFHVHVRQNNSFFSLALMTEQVEKDFLDRWNIDDGGALYKAGENSTYDSVTTFEKKTRTNEDTSDLQSLINNLSLVGTARETYVFDNIDVPAMVNYMAMMAITQDIDGSNKNHFLYRDTEDSGEWRMLPYDLDLTFGPDALNTDAIVYNRQNTSTPACASHPFIGARPYLLHGGKYNRFLELIVNTPRTRTMLLRRLRTLVDAQIATPYFQNRIDALNTLISSDVLADKARWGSNAHFPGVTYTLQQANDRIKAEHLTPRLGFLGGSSIAGVGTANPASQPPAPPIQFGAVDFFPESGNQSHEFVELRNPNAFATDLSGWSVTGEIEWTLKPGTVIPAGESLFLTPNARSFRERTLSPKGAERRFLQGDYPGQLSARGGTLVLKNGPEGTGGTIAAMTYSGTPTDAQQFLRITEVNFAPAPGGGSAAAEYEFIELRNIGPSSLSLTGIRISGGMDFSFDSSTITSLAPGAYVLVVRNPGAFQARYGASLPIAGVFAGALDNSGDRIHLIDATGENILDFVYSPAWQAFTNTGGFTLTILNDAQVYSYWKVPAGWKTGGKLHGTPGGPDIEGDTDDDGISDLWETQHGLSPTQSTDAIQDPDGDHQSNLDEYLANTNPHDPSSRFCIASISCDSNNNIHLSFAAAAGRNYAIQRSPDFVSWTVIHTETAGEARVVEFTELLRGSTQFYRIVTPAPPE